MNPNASYELWVVMMYQCRFINYNKCSTMEQDADTQGGLYLC